jgi:Pyruvate kinase, barrel domain
LNRTNPMAAMRKTKIIATLGPATDSAEMLNQLVQRGVDVFRLNMSHAPHDWVRRVVRDIRSAANICRRFVGIMLDTQGPAIRLATGLNRYGTVRWLGNCRSEGRINFLVAAIRRLIVDAVVIIIGHPADVQRQKTQRKRREASSECEVIPRMRAMDIDLHVVVRLYLASGCVFLTSFDGALWFGPLFYLTLLNGLLRRLPLHDMRIDVERNRSMLHDDVGVVHAGIPFVCTGFRMPLHRSCRRLWN